MNVNVAVPQEITSILNMPARSRLVYHVGFLALDRGDTRKNLDQRAVHETANIAWKLYERGSVTLVQKRLGKEMFEYSAVRI